jgi:hypothetical protein
MKMIRRENNLKVGEPDVRPDAPSHVRGVKQGNRPSGIRRHLDEKPVGPLMAEATARRSTGINAEGHGPIDPRMPKVTPA